MSAAHRQEPDHQARARLTPGMLDCERAGTLAAQFTPAGPRVSHVQRSNIVELLHRSALDAPAWVGDTTGLTVAARRVADSCDVRVLDRAGYARLTGSALAQMVAGLPGAPDGPEDLTQPTWRRRGLHAATPLIIGQIALALSAVSSRVLGQVIPASIAPALTPQPGRYLAAEPSRASGRGPRMILALVAPNVLALQRDLFLDRLDLPAWVCLHETVHAVQLEAAPWLTDYLTERLRALVYDLALLGPTGMLTGLRDGREHEHLADLLTVLAFLEGHAQAVLDAIEPADMPSVYRLRAMVARTQAHDGGVGPGPGAGALLNRVLGVGVKERQYAQGADFVRTVLSRVGHDGLNRVWNDPSYLPTAHELAHPSTWMDRVVHSPSPSPHKEAAHD